LTGSVLGCEHQLMPQSRAAATFAWTGKCSMDSGSFDVVLESIVESKSVQVTITHQAVTLHGVEDCKQIAELKIVKSMQDGQPPQQVEVSEADFNK